MMTISLVQLQLLYMDLLCTEEVCVVEVSYTTPKGSWKGVERMKISIIDGTE